MAQTQKLEFRIPVILGPGYNWQAGHAHASGHKTKEAASDKAGRAEIRFGAESQLDGGACQGHPAPTRAAEVKKGKTCWPAESRPGSAIYSEEIHRGFIARTITGDWETRYMSLGPYQRLSVGWSSMPGIYVLHGNSAAVDHPPDKAEASVI
eukprot:scaffold220233_cov34-Prasinocladus_malaysianus.AAC.1